MRIWEMWIWCKCLPHLFWQQHTTAGVWNINFILLTQLLICLVYYTPEVNKSLERLYCFRIPVLLYILNELESRPPSADDCCGLMLTVNSDSADGGMSLAAVDNIAAFPTSGTLQLSLPFSPTEVCCSCVLVSADCSDQRFPWLFGSMLGQLSNTTDIML